MVAQKRTGGDLVAPSCDQLVRRLKRIEGQVRGLQRMIEEGRSCSEVLVQLSALREALNRVGVGLIVRQMESCFREENGCAESADDRSGRLREAVQLFLKFS
jgi:DNA-binding FrmR family transcriptional regulator